MTKNNFSNRPQWPVKCPKHVHFYILCKDKHFLFIKKYANRLKESDASLPSSCKSDFIQTDSISIKT